MFQKSWSTRSVIGLFFLVTILASIGCPPASDPDDGLSQSSSDQNSASQSANVEASDNPSNRSPSESDSAADSTGPTTSDAAEAIEDQEPYREALFEGWEDPQVALFVTGRQNGYIEPCGCTGLANQKGGLLRRHTFYNQLLDKQWPLVALDLGNQIRRFGMQPVIKFERTFETLAQMMDYQAILLGPDDLRIDSITVYQTVENYQGDFNPLVSANYSVLFDELVSKYRIIETNGIKIGVTGILGEEFHREILNSDVTFTPVDAGLEAVLAELVNESCDYHVLLGHTSVDECERIADAYPHFDLIVSAGGDGEPTRDAKQVTVGEHTTHIIQTGYKGMHVGVVGIFPDAEMPIRYQRVPLDARFADSEEVKSVFVSYQDQLKSMGLNGLDIRALSHPSGRSFVGSDVCGDCHTTAYDIWEKGHDGNGGPHYHATKSLVEPGERTWVQRHHDPECLSCHVTGWNPQNYYPYQGGYLELEGTEHLHGNGCENCHGPGSAHVEAELGEVNVDDDELLARQLGMRVTLEQAKRDLCMRCHDLDNSPDFHVDGAWEKYWPRIEHYGID